MIGQQKSLRRVVESWLGPHDAEHFRVTRSSHTRRKLCRYVLVEVTHQEGTLAIVFFRHADGSWCVFPPPPRRPVMGGAV